MGEEDSGKATKTGCPAEFSSVDMLIEWDIISASSYVGGGVSVLDSSLPVFSWVPHVVGGVSEL